MIHVYIDNEFDAVRMHGRYLQQVIAIGAWLCNDAFERVDSFYALVRPAGFQRLSLHVRKMTHLRDDQIRQAMKFPDVADRFLAWMRTHANGEEITMYSFGPDDARTLCANAAFYHYEEEALFQGIVDLQTLLSSRVQYHGEVFQKAHSLETLKQVYRVKGEVNHNALSDALDLYHIHQAYREERALDEHKIAELYQTMRQKQREGARKRRQHQLQRLKEQMADVLEQPLCLGAETLARWDRFYSQLLVLAADLQLPILRSLRRQSQPEALKAYVSADSVRMRCWLCFVHPQTRVYYSIDIRYPNVPQIHRFLKQWFIVSPVALEARRES